MLALSGNHVVTFAPAAWGAQPNRSLWLMAIRVSARVCTMYTGRPPAFWIVSTGLRANRFCPVTTLPIARGG